MDSNKLKLARPNYYQGILQLRDINGEIINFVYNQIKKRGDVYVTKTVKFSNGIDLYMSSQKFIRILGKKLKQSFGGELKISSRLHTRRHGKDLYRVNLLFKLTKYKKGSIISVRDERLRIISMGRKVFARDLKTGKKVTIRQSDLPRD